MFQHGVGGVGESGDGRQHSRFDQHLDQAARPERLQRRGERLHRVFGLQIFEHGGPVVAGEQIDRHRRAGRPVARHLQHDRAGQAAMGEQQGFVERRPAGLRAHVAGDAGNAGEAILHRPFKREGDERSDRVHHAVSEPPREIVGEARGAHLRDGEPAGGDDDAPGRDRPARCLHPPVFALLRHVRDHCLKAQHAASGVQLGQQQIDHRARFLVAEELAQRLFMPAEAMARHQLAEIGRRVARQRRFCEMRIFAEETAGRGVDVGEIAPTAAGDADLFGRLPGVVEHQHPPSEPTGASGVEQPRRAGADHHIVEGFSHGRCMAANALTRKALRRRRARDNGGTRRPW